MVLLDMDLPRQSVCVMGLLHPWVLTDAVPCLDWPLGLALASSFLSSTLLRGQDRRPGPFVLFGSRYEALLLSVGELEQFRVPNDPQTQPIGLATDERCVARDQPHLVDVWGWDRER